MHFRRGPVPRSGTSNRRRKAVLITLLIVIVALPGLNIFRLNSSMSRLEARMLLGSEIKSLPFFDWSYTEVYFLGSKGVSYMVPDEELRAERTKMSGVLFQYNLPSRNCVVLCPIGPSSYTLGDGLRIVAVFRSDGTLLAKHPLMGDVEQLSELERVAHP